MRIHLLVPPGGEANELIQHLRRMGCSAVTSWPPPPQAEIDADVVFISIRHLIEDPPPFDWNVEDPSAALIAIADYENPLMVEKTLSINAQSIITMPLRTFGVLMEVLLSVANFKREQERRAHIRRLEEKVRFSDKIEKAKAIVARQHGVNRDEGYTLLRQFAMRKRVTIAEIVEELIAGAE
ncbi:ANTAR domain-containing response regulator [Roseivivax sediminis]|uniref:ANTAR domain-containing response regulator n=1 Tax=Roseivivax sediminis TaxID=936889 RepID=UPI00165FAB12|nr:ANTAR domain-containing protein [Roseivivax sediminis]